MKSSLRTVLALVVTSIPWVAMMAQPQQGMKSTSEPRIDAVEQAKPASDSDNNMKMMTENPCGNMQKGKMDKNKKKMKKKEDKQEENSTGFSIYG